MNRFKQFVKDHHEAIIVSVLTATFVGVIGHKMSQGNKPYRVDIFTQPADLLKDAVVVALVTKVNGKTMSADLEYLGEVDIASHNLQAV